MSTLVYGTTPLDPKTYAVVPVILVIATALASYLAGATAVSSIR